MTLLTATTGFFGCEIRGHRVEQGLVTMRTGLAKGLIGALALAACADPAFAQQTGPLAAPTRTPTSPFIGTIQVTASVGNACGFLSAPNDTHTVSDIDTTPWSKETAFTLDCNVASKVAVKSTNGGLQGPAFDATAGYTNLAPYTVALHLAGANGVTADASCAAAALKDGSCAAFYGTAALGQTPGLRLAAPSVNVAGSKITVSAPAFGQNPGNLLVNGTYADTLTVTVAASP